MHDANAEIRPLAMPRLTMLRLQRPSEDDMRRTSAALGFDLVRNANVWSEGTPRNARIAGGEWLVADGPKLGEVAAKLGSILHHAHEFSPGKVGWIIKGSRAPDLIAGGCSLDLDSNAFPPGSITRTLIAQSVAILARPSIELSFEIIIDRSLEGYFAAWLADAANGLAGE